MIAMAEREAIYRCQNCGKQIDILHPNQWGYKVKHGSGYKFYCTWKCLRADEMKKKPAEKTAPEKRENKDRLQVLADLMDVVSEGRDAYDYLKSMGYTDPKDTLRRLRIQAKEEAPKIYQKMEQMGMLDLRKGHSGKGVDKMSKNKLTREQKENAVDLALNGGDYLEYLKKCGAKNPSAAWWYIRKTLGKSNPKLLEQINQKTGEGAEVEVAEKLPPEAVAEVPEGLAGFQVVNLPLIMTEEHTKAHNDGIAAIAESLEAMNEKIKKPVNYDGFDVVCIRGEFGEYKIEGKNFRYANPAKIMYIDIHKDDMAAFMNELKKAAQILGVNV